ncbi:MAG: glutamate-5-semialdehyde dehydrogenase [Actinomycetota bacterium]|nr:glutamate-5-semialdehyde dehydrogenase [Actinomycetota bacterium]
MIEDVGRRARAASRRLAELTASGKNAVLEEMASRLEAQAPLILEANASDLEEAGAQRVAGALLDRLRLDEGRVASMAAGLRKVAALPDPVGELTGGWRMYNGVQLERRRVPLGVVAVIYEARPNVTADAAALCLKSGNAVILRGSSYALRSNLAIGELLRQAASHQGVPEDAVQVVRDTTREGARALMQAKHWVDLLVPRGGPSLIAAIESEATVPYVLDGAGNCHVYVDQSADLDEALGIVVNAKAQRPGVCNAAETLLVHEAVAAKFLPVVSEALAAEGVEMRGDEAARSLAPGMGTATDEDWATEYLDLILAVRVVPDLEAALDHIRSYGSGHTEAIVAEDLRAAESFVRGTDSAVVMVNASTRFTDGEEFGFGAEIGISTQKLHVRGPMGLEALTTERYVLRGEGQVR